MIVMPICSLLYGVSDEALSGIDTEFFFGGGGIL